MPAILALEKQLQGDGKFEDSLGYITTPCLKKKKKKKIRKLNQLLITR
jgi:hypothetical protein